MVHPDDIWVYKPPLGDIANIRLGIYNGSNHPLPQEARREEIDFNVSICADVFVVSPQ